MTSLSKAQAVVLPTTANGPWRSSDLASQRAFILGCYSHNPTSILVGVQREPLLSPIEAQGATVPDVSLCFHSLKMSGLARLASPMLRRCFMQVQLRLRGERPQPHRGLTSRTVSGSLRKSRVRYIDLQRTCFCMSRLQYVAYATRQRLD